ncbi:MAG: GDP-L-fucose synthase [Sideroxyarcus sp.]|nr:GDP-L-fucose synthase [Sideroxyarcus sp.]
MNQNSKIYIAGHRGLVGSALVRRLQAKGYRNLITRTHAELDLTDQAAVREFFATEKPEVVLLAAAKVGGIHANHTYPAEFIHDNLVIQDNVIHSAWQNKVNRLLFLGSSCIYPKQAPQPMTEDCLLTGPLEPTNRPYALAKIAGIEMCHAYNRQYGTKYMAVMPTNLYGPNDNYDLNNSHVLPAMIRKIHLAKLAHEGDIAGIARNEATLGIIPADLKAKLLASCTLHLEPEVTLWGTGTPKREFLYSEDMADACIFLLNMTDNNLDSFLSPDASVPPLINIGCGEDLTIRELAELVAEVIGFKGALTFDTSKPDGTMRKVMDVSRINALGWKRTMQLKDGIALSYQDMLSKI